ncbi:MAG: hypothetical protein V7K38_27690 [Nostoc sp.]|uniref:hypothetical protein n=1 Tax=Nostoc sp. TaxID=1180 RepID=UPI002FF5296F
MRKTTIFTLTLLSLAIIPAIAQVQTGGLGQVWTDFQSYSTDLQNYLQYNLSDTVEAQNQNNLTNTRGELNIPNPVAAGKQVRDDSTLYSRSDKFENNAAVRGNLIGNELNRVVTRGAAESVLGENGQIRSKAKLENIQTAIESVTDVKNNNDLDSEITKYINQLTTLANTANPADKILTQGLGTLLTANQETLKIQREQIKIVGESYAKSTQLEQSLQYSNLNLATISQQTEEANRARRVETSTEAARLLRATSQIDLFGREVNK